MPFFKKFIYLVNIDNKNSSWKYQLNSEQNQDSLLSQSIATSLSYKIGKLLLGWKVPRKRVSVSTSTYYYGSITIEAALVLPIFLYFLMNLTSIFLIFHLSSQIDAYLYKNAKQLSIIAYPLENGMEPSAAMTVAGEILTVQGLQYKINQDLKSFGVLESSISLLQSKLFEEDYISLVATYQVSPLVNVIPFSSIGMSNQCHMRCFTGYKYDELLDSSSVEQYVYITEQGSVYHLTSGCTYLDIRTNSVAHDEVEDLRNNSGGIYYSCANCYDTTTTLYYVTQYGTRYHTSAQCTSIERDVIAIPISEVGGRPLCSRCNS